MLLCHPPVYSMMKARAGMSSSASTCTQIDWTGLDASWCTSMRSKRHRAHWLCRACKCTVHAVRRGKARRDWSPASRSARGALCTCLRTAGTAGLAAHAEQWPSVRAASRAHSFLSCWSCTITLWHYQTTHSKEHRLWCAEQTSCKMVLHDSGAHRKPRHAGCDGTA